MLKKLLINQKGYKILSEFSIILISQYNSVSIKNYYLLKNELNKLDGVYPLYTQNKITQKILKKIGVEKKNEKKGIKKVFQKGDIITHPPLSNTPGIYFFQTNNKKRESCYDKLSNLFQGPTFLLGINTIEQLITIQIIMKNFPNFIFVGGVYINQILSHYLVNKLLNLSDRSLQKDSAIFDLIPLLTYKVPSILLLHMLLKCYFFSLIKSYNKKKTLNSSLSED